MATIANPYDKAHELARSIINSSIYANYIQAKERVEKQPEYREKIFNFREKQMRVNRAELLGEELPETLVHELSVEFAKLNRTKEIADFFQAEQSFIRMFSDIQEILHKSLQVGLGE
ncbi:MAG: YlbF family regulator [Syntrophomonadaceae bacterium]|jgi:cell fate (sporulation/competence/biofilm development) regulator YlbF (YheA/YmcA/DUF963 family)